VAVTFGSTYEETLTITLTLVPPPSTRHSFGPIWLWKSMAHPPIYFKQCSGLAEQIDSLVQFSPPDICHASRPDVLTYVEYSLNDSMRTAEARSSKLVGEERSSVPAGSGCGRSDSHDWRASHTLWHARLPGYFPFHVLVLPIGSIKLYVIYMSCTVGSDVFVVVLHGSIVHGNCCARPSSDRFRL